MDTDVMEYEGTNRVDEARAKLQEWSRENPAISNLSGAELSLLKQMIAAPEKYREQQFFLICEFLDHEDALDHVNAYYEAKELGMDTGYNVAYMFACAASNEHMSKTNRVAMLLDSLSHFRYTANTPRDEKKRAGNPVSPIA